MSWFLVPLVLVVLWFVGWQVYNAMFPERGTVVRSGPPAPAAPNTPPR